MWAKCPNRTNGAVNRLEPVLRCVGAGSSGRNPDNKMAQHQQHAVALACKLIKELHGDIVGIVARQMSAKGLQTLPDIIRGTCLPESQVLKSGLKRMLIDRMLWSHQ